MVAYGKETNDAGGDKTDDGRDAHGQSHFDAAPIDNTAQYTGHGIDFLVEDDRFVVEQHVADDTTRRTGNTAHDDSHPEGLAEGQALLYACNGEERQAQRVEDEPRILQRFHPFPQKSHGEQGHGGADQIDGRCHPEGCHAQHHVAYGTTADGHGYATDIAAKPVEVFGGSMADARDGKGKRTQDLYNIYDDILVQDAVI